MTQPRVNIYVIPTECPYEEQLILASPETWQTIKFAHVALLIPELEKGFLHEFQLRPNLWLAWTCTGCTAAFGNIGDVCHYRKCKMGGEPIETS